MIQGRIVLPEDFLIQNSFQMYCAGSNSDCVKYWENYMHAHPHHVEQILEAKRLYFILNGSKRPLNESIQHIEKKFLARKSTLLITKSFLYKVAATLLILVSTGLIIYNLKFSDRAQELISNVHTNDSTQTFYANNGERKKVKLSDGTVVSLNAGSTLTLGANFDKSLREVFLNGEGFFEVTHNNSPFIVHTRDFNIKVLGTKFNVKAYDDESQAEASLISGAIKLELLNRKSHPIDLKPGEKLSIINNAELLETSINTSKSIFDVEEIKLSKIITLPDNTILETAWVNNRIEIYKETFIQLKSTLERWYNVKIDIRDTEVQEYEFTALFTTESIEEALLALQKAKYFSYKITGNKILITK